MKGRSIMRVSHLWGMLPLLFMFQFIQGMNETYNKMWNIQDQMIWTNENLGEGTQQYVVFRKNFQLKNQLADPSIEIFADSRYLYGLMVTMYLEVLLDLILKVRNMILFL